ncbi:DUF5715 family protein [Modestobacter altitudinis]|uniref:DUF5715 family protein n=1 Tax=Modestobacter altitudinis TaxID=2213158 RepID=UPI00110D0A2B|nr:DUF5715 family protein [Modestobacter altitudinis]
MDGDRGATTSGAPTSEHLFGYRAAVDAVVQHLADLPADQAPPEGAVLADAADRPAVRLLLDRLPEGAEGALARIERDVLAFRSSARSNASTPATLLKILLLHQVDVVWWSSVAPFPDDRAVLGSPELTSLRRLQQQRRLPFSFRVGATGLPGRARDYAVRRCAPGRQPQSSGLSFPLARPAMIGLLSEIATAFAQAAAGWRRGLWVNCIVRSNEGQQRLRDLGYSAFLPSAHCVGYAADIEMTWLRRNGVAAPLQQVLTTYRDAGVLNVIDEGQAWHVCLNPAWVGRYEAVARPLLTAAGPVP